MASLRGVLPFLRVGHDKFIGNPIVGSSEALAVELEQPCHSLSGPLTGVGLVLTKVSISCWY